MADPSVSERRIRPIQDAISAGNWKQALQQCEKWQKKGEKSDKFLALRAHILVNLAEKAQQERGRTETLQLCHRTPPVTDVEAIHQLQDTLKQLSLDQMEGGKLWERAVAVRPADKDLLIKWMNGCIADSNWTGAQKAARELQSAFPKERQYDFWNILLCYLIQKDESLPDKDRTLFGTLAYRRICKAAELVPTDQEQLLSPGKAIATPEELYLLVHIYLAADKAADAVILLQSSTLGPNSQIGKQDPQLHLSLLLEVLETSKCWKEASKICQTLLSNSEHKNDDRIWKLLLRALREQAIDENGILQTLKGLSSHTDKQNRSAQLALLAYFQQFSNSDEHIDTILKYYDNYYERAFCFEDLRRPLQHLDQAGLKKIRNHLSSEALPDQNNAYRLFCLKFNYAFETNREPLAVNYLQSAKQALKLYNRPSDKESTNPEAALLAAMSLLRIAEMSSQRPLVLQVVLLLQCCSEKFPDYYQFSVLLVQCYSFLGLLSLAMDVFTKLDIKNMQWETVGHFLFSRISTLHPHQSGSGKNVLNPSGALEAALAMLEKSNHSLIRSFKEGLSHGSYSNIINTVRVRSDLKRSFNKQLVTIEDRRIGRAMGLPDDSILEQRSEILVDKRDFAFLPRYSKSDHRIYEYLRCGPLPTDVWIDAMSCIEYVFSFLKSEIASQPTTKIEERLQKISQNHTKFWPDHKDKLTSPELQSTTYFSTIAETILARNNKREGTHEVTSDNLIHGAEEVFTRLLEEVARPAPTIRQIPVPIWSYLHAMYIYLEELQGCALFLTWLSLYITNPKSKSKAKPNKPAAFDGNITKEDLVRLVEQGRKVEAAIIESVKRMKEGINKPGVLGSLVDIGFGRGEVGADGEMSKGMNALSGIMEQICDEATMETICGRVKESWEDALDGILMVKIKWPK